MNEKFESKLNDIKSKYENYYEDGSISEEIASYLQYMTECNFELMNGYLGRMQEIHRDVSEQVAHNKVQYLSLEQQIEILKAEIRDLSSSGGRVSEVEQKKSEIHRIRAEKIEWRKNEVILKNREKVMESIIKTAITLMSNLKATKQLQ
jgi:hypothetical protein